ncbi:MAG: hypothetical protein Q8P34_20475 [Bacteroidota bacterium]|nr:hypothetical protein [Bacteroidota bacterium]
MLCENKFTTVPPEAERYLIGTISGESYPATINLGSIASVDDGTIRKTLGDVNGTTGKSYTNIRKLDSGTDITYENWLVYVG